MTAHRGRPFWPETARAMMDLLLADPNILSVSQLGRPFRLSRQRVHQLLNRAGYGEQAKQIVSLRASARREQWLTYSKEHNATVEQTAKHFGIPDITVYKYFERLGYQAPRKG